jgi:membrane associated rhomboid family serine protease
MINASVGFHCPDCVREENRGARPVRTVVGGRQASGIDGLVTKILVAVNIAVFIAQQIGGAPFDDRLVLASKFYNNGLGESIGVAYGQWYRLLTAMFLHVGIWHIAINMISLYIIGIQLERMIGRSRFVATYFVTGLAGSAASYLFLPRLGASEGASGAIFGLVGALLVLGWRQRYDVRLLVFVIVANIAVDFGIAGIDWHAHIGGLIAGLVLGFVFAYAPRAWRSRQTWKDARTVLPVVASAALLGISAALVAVHTAQLNAQYPTSISTGAAWPAGQSQAIANGGETFVPHGR